MFGSLKDNESNKFRGSASFPSVAVTSEEVGQSFLLDEISSSLMYTGEGEFGSLETENKWKIKKIEITLTGVSIKCASNLFDKAWSDRLTLTYV